MVNREKVQKLAKKQYFIKKRASLVEIYDTIKLTFIQLLLKTK